MRRVCLRHVCMWQVSVCCVLCGVPMRVRLVKVQNDSSQLRITDNARSTATSCRVPAHVIGQPRMKKETPATALSHCLVFFFQFLPERALRVTTHTRTFSLASPLTSVDVMVFASPCDSTALLSSLFCIVFHFRKGSLRRVSPHYTHALASRSRRSDPSLRAPSNRNSPQHVAGFSRSGLCNLLCSPVTTTTQPTTSWWLNPGLLRTPPLCEADHSCGMASMALSLRWRLVDGIKTVATGVSLVACTWLLVKLSSDTSSFRSRLFPTQLRWLAVVDIFFALSSLPVPGLSTEAHDVYCQWGQVLFNLFRHLSLWIEIHIALSFALLSFKMRCATLMYRCLPCVCAPALVCTLLSAFMFPWTYDRHEGLCLPVRDRKGADPLSVADLSLCVCICSGCYIVVALRSRWRQSPYSVQTRVCARAEMYILNVLFTYLPVFLLYLRPTLLTNAPLNGVASACEFSGGLLNTITYALQSRYAAALLGGPSTIRQQRDISGGRPSFYAEIALDGATIVEFSDSFEAD